MTLFFLCTNRGERMDEAEYRARLEYKLCELGVSYSARSAIIEAKVKDCEDRAYYNNRSLEEEFERELEAIGDLTQKN